MHRTGFNQCQVSSAALGRPGVGVLRIIRTQLCCLVLKYLLKLSSHLVAFYFLQGSPSPCNLQNKLPPLRMPNSNIIRSVEFHCHGNTMAMHFQHGITSKNTVHNESTKVQTLGVFLGIDRSMSWKQRCCLCVLCKYVNSNVYKHSVLQ